MRQYDIKPNDVTGIELRHHDTCYSDYFQGSPANEVLAIPVHAGMTYRELMEAMRDEFNSTDGWFSQVAGSGTMFDDASHALMVAAVAGSSHGDVNKPCDEFSDIESDSDGMDSIYAYFGLFAETE